MLMTTAITRTILIMMITTIIITGPGIRRGSEDSHGNDNRNLWKNIFRGKKSTSKRLFYENWNDGSMNAN